MPLRSSLVLLLSSLIITAQGSFHDKGHGTYYPSNAACVDYTIPLSVATDNALKWNDTKWEDNFGLVDFVSRVASRKESGFPLPPAGSVPFKDNVEIAGTFCSPKKKYCEGKDGDEAKGRTILLATHGLGSDRGYWNSAYNPEEYNFVQFAVDKGYAVFFYDRLGTGKSSKKLSGFTNQASIQVSVLSQLSAALKAGKYTGKIGVPKSVVLLGHSFGSFIAHALLAAEPESADGAILTGAAYGAMINVQVESFNLRIAARQKGRRWEWAEFDDGYVTWDDIYGNVNNFFKAPWYVLPAVEYTERSKQPFAILELFSVPSLNFDASNFTGPILYISGEYDFTVCAGYCPGLLEQPAKTFFSGSRSFEAYVQPMTGHLLNFHKNATEGFKVVTEFLGRNGL